MKSKEVVFEILLSSSSSRSNNTEFPDSLFLSLSLSLFLSVNPYRQVLETSSSDRIDLC